MIGVFVVAIAYIHGGVVQGYPMRATNRPCHGFHCPGPTAGQQSALLGSFEGIVALFATPNDLIPDCEPYSRLFRFWMPTYSPIDNTEVAT
jgi:hypothetical protein